MPLKEAIKKILQQEDELTEIVQLVGKDSLSEDQKAILKVRVVVKLILSLDRANHQGRVPPVELILEVRLQLPHAQDYGHDEGHC